ncbi:tripartite tricarboxylate transporter TctB family protein [Maritalea sp.]|uniref:tripartite tricarboxylate transporter TctB family protein n=1 Tax=Maritalea sp. TaxID=2003361 RepID=UPI003EF714D9
MTITSDRIAGFCSILFGAALLVWITPLATETVDYGWMRPNTLPDILAWVLIVAGIGLSVSSSEPSTPSFLLISKAAVYFLVIVASLFAISYFGYLRVAPILAAIIMILLGERRWPWLFAGAVVVPFAIWFFIEFLLSRPLP